MGALNLPIIASGQLQPYQTSNDADADLELAVTAPLTVDLSGGDHTLTGAEFTRAILFKTTGNSVLRTLTTPATARLFAVENAGSHALNVTTGSTTLSVAAGDAAIFYTDGTANGIITVVASSGASGAAGGDLAGTYPNPTIKSSVGLSGSPTTTTQSPGDNSTKISTTAFVTAAIAAIVGGLVFKGTWNANTNTPTITSGSGTLGWFYKVSVAGTTTIDGISVWNVNDMLLYDGAAWLKIDGQTSEVISVAGRTGVVTLASGDISGLAASATTDTTDASNITSGSLALARITAIADQRLLGNVSGGSAAPIALTAAQVSTFLSLVASATTDTTNASNISSGTLNAARLPNTTVAAGSYGDGTHTGQFTVDSAGRLTAAASVTITGAAPTGAAGGDLAGTYPNPTIKSSVALGGSPTTTTQSPADNSTKISTTAYVDAAIAAIVGGMVYKGTWNANTNSPTITSGVGTLGWFYKVSVAGTTSIDGNASWIVGDLLLFDGSVWDKIDGNTTEVTSVAGRTGAVTLASGDISGLVASATTDTTNAANISSGILPDGRMPDLTGDVTSSDGSVATTIAAAAVTLSKMANLAANSIIGNNTGSPATPLALTAAQVSTFLSLVASATTDTTNASNISSGTLAAARMGAHRMYISTFLAGLQTAATQRILRYHVAIAMTWPSAGSKASASAASTGTAVFTVKQNGSSIGTITFTSSATGVVAVTGGPLTFAIDDIIDIFGPASADATLADIAVTLATTAAGA